jgi:hypothetical protein
MVVRLPARGDPEWIDMELIGAARRGDFDGIAKAIRKGAPFDRIARETLADLFDQERRISPDDLKIDELLLDVPILSEGVGYWMAVPKGRVPGKPPKPPFTFDMKEIEVSRALLDAWQRGCKLESAVQEIMNTYGLSRSKVFEIWKKYGPERRKY